MSHPRNASNEAPAIHATINLVQAQGQWVVLMDGDLSHHPKHIPEFLEQQVLGTRQRIPGHHTITLACQ